MTATKTCSNQHMSKWHYVNCKAPATVTRDGKDYCRHHDPEKAKLEKAGKNVATMYAVTKSDSPEDAPLEVMKVQVQPHGTKEFKVLSAIQINPKGYQFGEDHPRSLALGCTVIQPREKFSLSLKEAFKKFLTDSAKRVEDARVKADEEVMRHDQELVNVAELIVELEVP